MPRTAQRQPAADGVVARVRRWLAKPGPAHLIRAVKRFTARLGTQFAAAITYFSFLALVPILMVSFAAVGYVLAARPDLVTQLKDGITHQIPGDLSLTLGNLVDQAINARLSVGLTGLLVALYTGIGWMGNLRAAVQAQWRYDFDEDQEIAEESVLVNVGKNLVRLIGLGGAITVSIALSTSRTLVEPILSWLGLDGDGWARPVFTVLPILLAVAASLLIFLWVFRSLAPKDQPAPRRAVFRGALIAAVGFEVLKAALTILLPLMSRSPTASIFGSVIGLMLFMNFTATLVLFVAAWIATAPGGPADRRPAAAQPATAADSEPEKEPGPLSVFGVGLLVGWLSARRRK